MKLSAFATWQGTLPNCWKGGGWEHWGSVHLLRGILWLPFTLLPKAREMVWRERGRRIRVSIWVKGGVKACKMHVVSRHWTWTKYTCHNSYFRKGRNCCRHHRLELPFSLFSSRYDKQRQQWHALEIRCCESTWGKAAQCVSVNADKYERDAVIAQKQTDWFITADNCVDTTGMLTTLCGEMHST